MAGAGGGLCQVSIMSPCTYLVTGAVTGNKDESTVQRIRRTYAAKGIKVCPSYFEEGILHACTPYRKGLLDSHLEYQCHIPHNKEPVPCNVDVQADIPGFVNAALKGFAGD